ncbi:signal peptide-containing protein [Theileria equi strain WA]|uniref:Signal peptide-containing protein n=1 Tax=Theileria equi strain WA TaxID=1537102 RepID=L0AXV2_THEEQ|nr:signal peptide-containing protein [Theileria equi strain WA]AFZ79744.1 signal peptide-containing protein [Theileria equi strain WA]|eukprot:XP_004829410.1 signal peptide-containing protein [Theileria equi strain WA]
MKVLTVLWTVCLVRLCHGEDDLQAQTSPDTTEQESPAPETSEEPQHNEEASEKTLQDVSTEDVTNIDQSDSKPDLKSKVDSSQFDLEEEDEGSVKVLKLTVKNGGTTKELKYDGKEVWSATWIVGFPCSSASLYFDGEKPTLVILKTKGWGGKESTVYKHHDGSKWNTGDKEEHNKKLEELRKKTSDTPVESGIIDISNKPNDKEAIFVEYDDEGIVYKSYTLRDNVTAKTVKDGDATIWTAKDGHECLKIFTYSNDNVNLCRLNVKSSDVITPHFFEKVDGEWKSLEHPTFSQKLNALLEPVNKKMRLEFLMLSDDVADLYEYYSGGMLVTIAFPKFKTTSVSYIGEIWKANDDKEECACARFYTIRGWICRVYIKKGDGTEIKNFEYSNNKWNSVTNRNTLINTCNSYIPSEDTKTKVTSGSIDVTKEDNTVYNTRTFTVSGVNVKRYIPLPDKFINEVKDGGLSIWKAPDGMKRCVSCEFKSKGNVSLTSMLVCTSFELWFLYFEKNGNGEWKSIERKEFDKKIEDMKNMETPQPSVESTGNDPQDVCAPSDNTDTQSSGQVTSLQESGNDHSESPSSGSEEQSPTEEDAREQDKPQDSE